MEKCSSAVDQQTDAHQLLIEEKTACQKQLIKQTEKAQNDMISREKHIIDEQTLQCEKEKEALIEQFTKSL